MRIIGCDPGPNDFSWAIYDNHLGEIIEWGDGFSWGQGDGAHIGLAGVERVRSYGSVVSNAVLETSETVGRLDEYFENFELYDCILIPRRTIVAHLTGSAVGGDKQVNAAVNLICPNFAKKRKGLNGHHRAAAAVAITCYDKFGKGTT